MNLRTTAQLKSLGIALLWALFALPALADSTSIRVGVNKNMEAQLMTPDGPGPYPAILLLHTSGGLQAADLDYAKRLVAKGYVVLVPAFLDAYGIRARTRKLTFTTYAQPIYADLVASLNLLRSDGKVDGRKLGAIGFSNGGYFALWLAATGEVQAGISYYGALTGAASDRSLSRFRQVFTSTSSPVLLLHGSDDSTVPARKAIELDSILTAAHSRHEFHQYPGAEHRFDREGGAANEAAAADAWQRTQAFLDRNLKDQP
jgi:carboxymethylenebutenolidase